MDRLILGIMAHVDAGKTTLSEALLYLTGQLKKLGRVDNRDAFLDTEPLERERGITIFSKQAVLPLNTVELTLLDTPGHVDFSAEMERTLQVLDCAVLVVSGTDGVQGHTQTLWRLLDRHGIPTLIFVNKMDLDGADRQRVMEQLRRRLDDGCVDFGAAQDAVFEEAAMCGEQALAAFLETGRLEDRDIAQLVGERRLFPCFFGSALRLEGVEELVDGLERFIPRKTYPKEFGAKVFKISRDARGMRLTHMKISGGSLRVKEMLRGIDAQGKPWEEKADQIRLYSGTKFAALDQAPAGSVVAVAGLSHSYAGEGLGFEAEAELPELTPVLSYRVELPEGADPHDAYGKLLQLGEEDPLLSVSWQERSREIHLQLMGEVQLEVLRALISERFGLEVGFGTGRIVYRETIAEPVLGAGHFEPLRHYAEVHLLLEPGDRGSGLVFDSVCSEDRLDRNWQRLILTHLEEKVHLGVLTGSPITDMKITLIAGRAHLKHTEGGDFRQATYRAVRQGLMSAASVLLEPWYDFSAELPATVAGRLMSDVQRMSGTVDSSETVGDNAVLTGTVPVSEFSGYQLEFNTYTRGQGRLSCAFRGYEPCHNTDEVVEALGYDSEHDLENTADSVFCSHGAGITVKWYEAAERMHVDHGFSLEPAEVPEAAELNTAPRRAYTGSAEQDKELQSIFERTYGPVKRREFESSRGAGKQLPDRVELKLGENAPEPEYLLVDGYNIIFALDGLRELARESLDAARKLLMDILCNYQGIKKCNVILVFDAYKVQGGTGEVSRYHNITVVYTKHAETADQYIEKTTYELGRKHRVRVATSDGVEQLIIVGHGARRQSAESFYEELRLVSSEISAMLDRINVSPESRVVKKAFEAAAGKDKK